MVRWWRNVIGGRRMISFKSVRTYCTAVTPPATTAMVVLAMGTAPCNNLQALQSRRLTTAAVAVGGPSPS